MNGPPDPHIDPRVGTSAPPPEEDAHDASSPSWGPNPSHAPIVFHVAARAWSRDATLDLVNGLRDHLGLPVQALRADRIAGPTHLVMALVHAQRAIATGRARTQDVGLEAALYAAGDRQIHRALKVVGVPFDGADAPVLLVPLARVVDEDVSRHALAHVIDAVSPHETQMIDLATDDGWPAMEQARDWWHQQIDDADGVVTGSSPDTGSLEEALLARMALLAVDKA